VSINLPEDFSFKQLSEDFAQKIEELNPNEKTKTVEEVCKSIFDQMSLDPVKKNRFYEEIKEIKSARFQDQSTQSIKKIKEIFQMVILSGKTEDSGYASLARSESVDDPISFFDVIYSLKKMIKEQSCDLNLSESMGKFVENYLKEERFLLSKEEKLALEDILKALKEKAVDPTYFIDKVCDAHLTEQYLRGQEASELIKREILSLPSNQGYSLGISHGDKISLDQVKTIQFFLRNELERICSLRKKKCSETYNILLSREKRNTDLYHIKQSLLDQRSLSLKKDSQELKPIEVVIQGTSYQIPKQYTLDLYQNQRTTSTIYHLKDNAYFVKNKKGAENLVLGMYKFCDDLLSKDVPAEVRDLFKFFMLVFTTQHLQNSLLLCSRSFVSTLRASLAQSEDIDLSVSSKIVYKDKKNEVFFSKGSEVNSVKIRLFYQGALDFRLEQPEDSLVRDEFEKARRVLGVCEPLTLNCDAFFEVRINPADNVLEIYGYENNQSLLLS
jgi:hypothetical protein